ncbi:MAG: hypothetical protein GTO51_07750 [Candidatus Latescibacteria bacterium]|nr:hypothetical protein [Candidatus Latescibacterota bacterium]NIM21727.1 hypothetical protein [Candidatus Latescibacterota bacterium]NIM65865.1 hypothetical protein [Candidatus Latescibacterota bacterium]NIO02610.1 hypothetical protein [Candidatus Latescibacterota bacterium]NIO29591.1 hypothetical protein [Candidatus Latescibacterota bacterium]
MKNIYTQLFDLLQKKKPIALGTIIETKGSSPQVPGASAIFSADGLVAGTLGGGWLEADAQKRVLAALKKRETLLCEFSLNADINAGEGAICGGYIHILIDARPEAHRDTFRDVVQSIDSRRSGALATFISKTSGERVELFRNWIDVKDTSSGESGALLSVFQEEIDHAMSTGKPALLKTEKEISPAGVGDTSLFLEPIFPLPQLVIAGAGHIGQVLAHIGSLLSFEVTVIDDRPEFANREKLPEADHIIVNDIGMAMHDFPTSLDTYIVIVTRGHQQDAEALRHVIASDAAYIGMIGSKRKIALMRSKFIEKGWATAGLFDHVHAPIGIEIHSETVEEIAISIAAQLVQARSSMKDKTKDSK